VKLDSHFRRGFLDGLASFGYAGKAFLAVFRRLLIKGDPSVFRDVDALWYTQDESVKKQKFKRRVNERQS
jgi:hypothetical protein